MKDPERYSLYVCEDYSCYMKATENGNYVKYEDYQRIRAKVDELLALLVRVMTLHKDVD